MLGLFKPDKNGNIRLTRHLYIHELGRGIFVLWDGDPGKPGSDERKRLTSFRLDSVFALALLGFLRNREDKCKDALVHEVLENAER